MSIAGFIALGLASLSSGQAQPLTEEAAADLAVKVSTSLRASRAQSAGAQASLDATEVGLVPEVEVSFGYERVDGFPDGELPGPGGAALAIEIPRDRWSARVGVSYSVLGVLIGRLQLIDAFEARARAEALRTQEREADVRLEAKRRFHTYLGAVQTASVAGQSLELSEARLKRIEARYEVGEATRADVAGARARRETRAAELIRAEGRRRQALDLLRSYLASPRLEVVAPARWPQIRRPGSADADPEALAMSVGPARPAVRSTEALLEAQDREIAAQWSDMVPDLRLAGSYLYANPNPNLIPPRQQFDGSWTAGVSIVWSLERALVGGATRGILEAGRARLEAERDDLLRRLGEQIRLVLVDLRSAEAIHQASGVRVDAARERFEATTAAFAVGRVTLDVLLDADVELARARLAVVAALVDHHLARARLERVLMTPDR